MGAHPCLQIAGRRLLTAFDFAPFYTHGCSHGHRTPETCTKHKDDSAESGAKVEEADDDDGEVDEIGVEAKDFRPIGGQSSWTSREERPEVVVNRRPPRRQAGLF